MENNNRENGGNSVFFETSKGLMSEEHVDNRGLFN